MATVRKFKVLFTSCTGKVVVVRRPLCSAVGATDVDLAIAMFDSAPPATSWVSPEVITRSASMRQLYLRAWLRRSRCLTRAMTTTRTKMTTAQPQTTATRRTRLNADVEDSDVPWWPTPLPSPPYGDVDAADDNGWNGSELLTETVNTADAESDGVPRSVATISSRNRPDVGRAELTLTAARRASTRNSRVTSSAPSENELSSAASVYVSSALSPSSASFAESTAITWPGGVRLDTWMTLSLPALNSGRLSFRSTTSTITVAVPLDAGDSGS